MKVATLRDHLKTNSRSHSTQQQCYSRRWRWGHNETICQQANLTSHFLSSALLPHIRGGWREIHSAVLDKYSWLCLRNTCQQRMPCLIWWQIDIMTDWFSAVTAKVQIFIFTVFHKSQFYLKKRKQGYCLEKIWSQKVIVDLTSNTLSVWFLFFHIQNSSTNYAARGMR